jgi:hypothetical protein
MNDSNNSARDQLCKDALLEALSARLDAHAKLEQAELSTVALDRIRARTLDVFETGHDLSPIAFVAPAPKHGLWRAAAAIAILSGAALISWSMLRPATKLSTRSLAIETSPEASLDLAAAAEDWAIVDAMFDDESLSSAQGEVDSLGTSFSDWEIVEDSL